MKFINYAVAAVLLASAARASDSPVNVDTVEPTVEPKATIDSDAVDGSTLNNLAGQNSVVEVDPTLDQSESTGAKEVLANKQVDEEKAKAVLATQQAIDHPTAIDQAPTAIDTQAPTAIDQAPTAIDQAPTAIDQAPTAIDQAPTAIDQAPTAIDQAAIDKQAAEKEKERLAAEQQQALADAEEQNKLAIAAVNKSEEALAKATDNEKTAATATLAEAKKAADAAGKNLNELKKKGEEEELKPDNLAKPAADKLAAVDKLVKDKEAADKLAQEVKENTGTTGETVWYRSDLAIGTAITLGILVVAGGIYAFAFSKSDETDL